eukprot:158321-Hanusia_phi.AAC.1
MRADRFKSAGLIKSARQSISHRKTRAAGTTWKNSREAVCRRTSGAVQLRPRPPSSRRTPPSIASTGVTALY